MNREKAARSKKKYRATLNINIINILFMRFFRICLFVAYVRLFSIAVPEGAFSHSWVYFFLFHFHSTQPHIDNCYWFQCATCSMQLLLLHWRYCALIPVVQKMAHTHARTHMRYRSANMAIIFLLLHLKHKKMKALREIGEHKKRIKRHKSYTIELMFIVCAFVLYVLILRSSAF